MDYENLKIGDMIGIRLDNRLYGIIRVIDSSTRRREPIYGKNVMLFAVLDWYNDNPPTLDVLKSTNLIMKLFNKYLIPPILSMNSFNWKNKPAVAYVPKDMFKFDDSKFYIGNIKQSKTDQMAPCNSLTRFDSLSHFLLTEWRWKHDRERLIKETELKNVKKLKLQQQEIEKRTGWLKNATLKDLLLDNPLKNWGRLRKDNEIREIKHSCTSFINTLENSKNDKEKKVAFEEFVQSINTIDNKGRNFIETEEREDLCKFCHEASLIAKYENGFEILESNRTW